MNKRIQAFGSCENGAAGDFIATLLGIGAGIVLLGWAILSGSAGATSFFYNPQGIAIVLGGTIAATLISFPASEVVKVFDAFRIVFSGQSENYYENVVNETVALSHLAREAGDVSDEREYISHPFLRDGVSLWLAGYNPTQIKETLETAIANRSIRELNQVKLLRSMGTFAPAFGMLGTLIGLVQMLGNLQTDLSKLGPGMAVALITTFYGTLLANLVFNPMAEKLESRRTQNLVLLNMTMEGVMLLVRRESPLYIEGVLNSFRPPNERTTRFDKKGDYKGQMTLIPRGKQKKKSTGTIRR